jgi:hypothetical protein
VISLGAGAIGPRFDAATKIVAPSRGVCAPASQVAAFGAAGAPPDIPVLNVGIAAIGFTCSARLPGSERNAEATRKS